VHDERLLRTFGVIFQALFIDITLIAYTGNDSWVEKTVLEIHKCLNSGKIPEAAPDCDYCRYVEALKEYNIL